MKLKTYAATVFPLLICILFLCSCSSPSEKANSNNAAPDNGSLIIEAKIVYPANDVRPVARSSFFLLDKDLLDVEVPSPQELKVRSIEEYTSKLSNPQNLKSAIRLAQAVKGMRADMERIGVEKNVEFPPETPKTDREKKNTLMGIQLLIIRMMNDKETAGHFLQEVITDFQGKVVIKDLRPGDYWIMGVTDTRKDYAFWNHKITIKPGENRLLLDQYNTLYFK